ncbi:MAG: J domain-containing protein [Clostridia bacterium]|nr:J domain-containing protein [Clostridia bacterium]
MNGYSVLNLPPGAGKEDIRRAYREMARRWHPDRFPEGPERDWASEKMAEINAAYRACMNGQTQTCADAESEKRALRRIAEMIEGGEYKSARSMLMNLATRCAEWNYLFGAILLKTSDVKKALIYLGIASRQQPENVKYARALREAQELDGKKGLSGLFSRAKGR